MNVFEAAAQAWRTSRRAAFATVIAVGGSAPRSTGARMLIYENGDIVGTIGGGPIEHRAIAMAREVIAAGQPVRFVANLTRDLAMCCGGEMEIYIEPLQISPPFYVFGAGHVARALAPLLLALDYSITIVDERTELITAERFPGCTLRIESPVGVAQSLTGGLDDHYFIASHNHQLDQDLVEILLPLTCSWIGMIGSRTKVARFLVRFKAGGMDPALFQKLRAPVGLDIGAETPAEIAIAIAGELVGHRRQHTKPPVPLSEIPLKARNGGQASS